MATDQLTLVPCIVAEGPSPANNNVALSSYMLFYLMNTAPYKMVTVVYGKF